MKTTFTYTVLRYVHDIATGEFVNMGVVLYAPEARYVSALCNPRYGRLSKMFGDAWKNGLWNLYQPVSMDLQDADTILDKANRWLGRATNLKDSTEDFRLWMLIGEPKVDKLRPAYAKALNILNKMPVDKDLVTEAEAAKFSEELAGEIAKYAKLA
jgi:Protein of unknown function (DUF3037)